MIREVTGDILLSEAHTIAHGVAPNDPFDRGLALSLRERWPSMHKDFRHYCHQAHPKPGGAWFWGGWGEAGSTRIVNLLTQEGSFEHGSKPGRATVAHVNHALRELRKYIEEESVPSVALPRLATGVGGLEWSDVEPLVQKHLGDLEIPVIVYTTFKKGEKADEGL